MPMVECASCGERVSVSADAEGRRVYCDRCTGTYRSTEPTSLPAKPRRPVDSDIDRDDDDDSDRPMNRKPPHRGGLIMGLGIGSLVLAMTSIGAISGFGPFGIPVSIAGFVIGILAWLWGSRDLKKMEAGDMDRRGKSNTQAGHICGIIGTILHSFGMLCGCAIGLLFAGFLGMAMTIPKPTPPAVRPNPPPVRPARQAPIAVPRVFAPIDSPWKMIVR